MSAGQAIRQHIPESVKAAVRARGCCAYCGVRSPALEVEHIYPFSRGGSNDLSNLAAACDRCNREKWTQTPEEWAETRRLAGQHPA